MSRVRISRAIAIWMLALVWMATLPSLPVFAQQPPPRAQPPAPTPAVLRLTVVDQTGAVIIGATVTVAGAEPATRPAIMTPVKTAGNGVAVIAGLAPGRYAVTSEFEGFETRTLPDVRLRPGDNRQVAVLAIKRVETEVTVAQDPQQSATDRQGPSFGTQLTRDQIEALSDDPATLQQQLNDMAGPGAVIRIDGFEGGALPAKAQIRSIRIARDQFAAEFHSAGGVSVEIITQPGIGPIRYFSNFLARPSGLSGRSPFVPTKGPEQNMNYGFGMGGTLVKEKSSFNLNVFGITAYDTPNLYTVTPSGTTSTALNLKAPRENLFVNSQVDYALTLDQTLRVGFNLGRNNLENLGVGGYDNPERAFSSDSSNAALRVQHFGPLGRRMFSRSRLQLMFNDSDSTSATEAPTIRVLDAFATGGAQRAGGEHSRAIDIASDLDYVLGRHSIRTGLVVNAGWYRSDSTSNYLGTYTFASLTAFAANTPRNYTRRVGDPNITFTTLQGSVYLQDDIRLRKNLTITPGVRYELQTHVGDVANVGPRFGVTWAPFASGQTTLRGSVGAFYDWLPTGTYEQTLRVDGFRQRELNIVNPAFPDPGADAVVPPVNRYLFGSDFSAPRQTRVSAGVDQAFFRVNRIAATYSYQHGARLARGINLNPLVNGVRADPAFANVIEVVSDAVSRQHQLQIDATINPGALLPDFRGPLIKWQRSTIFSTYTLLSLRNNTDGAFSIPATGNLDDDWGPASGGGFFGGFGPFQGGPPQQTTDIRHRLNFTYNNQIVRNTQVSFNLTTSSAPPYTLLSGTDDNADGIFNDRPAGVGRNTLRASRFTVVNMQVGYVFAFGRGPALPPAIGVFGGGGAAQVRTFDQGNARYRLNVFVQAQNLTNNRNYRGYSGVLTSPFFGQATTVGDMRKVEVGIGLNF
jgi:hypothetical protein